MTGGKQDGATRAQPSFSALPRASLADVIYEQLRDVILHGTLADGSRLSQVRLASDFGVSRIPIREALCRLQAESLVTATPYSPFVVRHISPAQVAELIDVRLALEDLALPRRPAVTASETVALRRLSERMSRAAASPGWFGLDREFTGFSSGPAR